MTFDTGLSVESGVSSAMVASSWLNGTFDHEPLKPESGATRSNLNLRKTPYVIATKVFARMMAVRVFFIIISKLAPGSERCEDGR